MSMLQDAWIFRGVETGVEGMQKKQKIQEQGILDSSVAPHGLQECQLTFAKPCFYSMQVGEQNSLLFLCRARPWHGFCAFLGPCTRFPVGTCPSGVSTTGTTACAATGTAETQATL